MLANFSVNILSCRGELLQGQATVGTSGRDGGCLHFRGGGSNLSHAEHCASSRNSIFECLGPLQIDCNEMERAAIICQEGSLVV